MGERITKRITFEEVKVHEKRSIICQRCGKRRTRSQVFRVTVNPFNKRPDGRPKSRSEVFEDVILAGNAWRPVLCATCEEVTRG